MEAINTTRVEEVWKRQDPSFFEQAIIDVDGTIAPTDAECKQGIDISYNGQWGYHPLVISLANTKEVLYLLNRPANRPSHENAAEYLDRAFDLCDTAGFKSIFARGDTDFSQTAHLDRWDDRGNVRGLDDRQRGVGRELDRPHITGGQLGAGRDVAHDLEDPDPFIGRREHEQHHPDGYQ